MREKSAEITLPRRRKSACAVQRDWRSTGRRRSGAAIRKSLPDATRERRALPAIGSTSACHYPLARGRDTGTGGNAECSSSAAHAEERRLLPPREAARPRE